MTFAQFLEEAEEIANDDLYLSNMSKSFPDKAWFLSKLPRDITTIVDFGGGAGEFAEYCQQKSNSKFNFIIIDNNASFLAAAKKKGFLGFASLDELIQSKDSFDASKTCLVMSSVIHEVYSYNDSFFDDIGSFWTSVKKCNFKAIAIRDMSISSSTFRNVPTEAILWVYQNVFKSDTFQYKGMLMRDIVDSFEDEWGAICDISTKKVNIRQLIHFLVKYRYQDNWRREVKENYLPISQDKLQYWIEDYMGYSLICKQSSSLEFYHKRWAKDFKLNVPDNRGFKREFLMWLSSISTHIKWLAVKDVVSSINEDRRAYLKKNKAQVDVEDVVSKFWTLRHRVKAPLNDIDYWIKKPFAQLRDFVYGFDGKNKSQRRSDEAKRIAEDNGAQLLGEHNGYEIWHVPSYEAAVQLGRFYKGKSCKWCISSEDPSFWFDMHDQSEFIFLIREEFENDENDKVAIEFEDGGRYFNVDHIRTWNINNDDEETFFNDELLKYAWDLFRDKGCRRAKWHEQNYM